MQYFEYGKTEIEYLSSRDVLLGKAIDRIGIIKRQVFPEPFKALIYSIIGQQISGKAADTVWNKLVAALGEITPETLGSVDLKCIQACGMSVRKSEYIKGIAEAALSGTVDFKKLDNMSDPDIINQLTKLRGVGVWTVEMLLIFSLCRPDVLSYNDFGIRKGIMKLHQLNEISRDQFEVFRKLYSPYGTTASLYLWEIAAGR
ncbi:MAG: DNA-3-methyladenine glycosylase 2 family protein [Clostridiaceae bacterium]|nr:DNA-3-methyladenine glycosylase 2 family protein [Clostridiaceae bacterium]